MNNPLEKDNSSLIVPIIIGAAAAAAITYLFVTEHGKELRGQIAETASKGWEDLQEKIPFTADDVTALKDKIVDQVSSGLKSVDSELPAPDTTI